MNRWKVWLVVALLGGLMGTVATGQTLVSVFDIEPGVAQLGAGGAGLSVVGGAETIYYNGATLSQLPGISFSSFYASYLGIANYTAAALTFRNFGLAAMLFGSSGITGYDDDGNQTETSLGYSSSAFMFAAGLDPSDLPFLPSFSFDFALGARLKALSTKVAEARGAGFSFDLGVWASLPSVSLGPVSLSDVAIAIAAENLFGVLSYDTTQESFGTNLQIGMSVRMFDVLLLAVDLRAVGGTRIGVTYNPVPTLALRLGAIAKDPASITAGLGVNVEGFQIDYAFVSHPLGGTHRVALTLDFSALDIGALSRSLRRILP